MIDLDRKPSEGARSAICRPKKAAGLEFKVAAIGATWSGLRFSRKKN